MKTFSLFLFAIASVMGMTSCDDDRTSGVCYCEFYSGQEQEYDLTHLGRSSQIDTCYQHSVNAGNFGGECSLE